MLNTIAMINYVTKLRLAKCVLVLCVALNTIAALYDYRDEFFADHFKTVTTVDHPPTPLSHDGRLFHDQDALGTTVEPLPTAIPDQQRTDADIPTIQYIAIAVSIFMLLSIVTVFDACTESYTLTRTLAIVWTLLFAADLVAHLALDDQARWHFLPAAGVVTSLWYLMALIDSHRIMRSVL